MRNNQMGKNKNEAVRAIWPPMPVLNASYSSNSDSCFSWSVAFVTLLTSAGY
eukprot:CAMPEP_0115309054 /NCGR_PEP_ID=MMETSP0270-20121206/74037_1 /TAXON_ID=71861 /ORGANISM="Scrippsiella trochoidea, Strain CCMP3099" /LENGTH=51 /DNA_ID=CAMNT_0002727673 /DNA_START=136 /DNA_END=288 /DNA_ORIENTATION=+